ncbi:MAG: dihydroorotase [Alphaproteobacteria bacterium]|nr:dihydroorotase [Alphaproteobacteria bacterium]
MLKIGDIVQPSDWHHHFRSGSEWLELTSKLCFSQFKYAVAMPNLAKPIQTRADAIKYHDEIVKYACNQGAQPVMTYYLNKELAVEEIYNTNIDDCIVAAKYYPLGVTNNSVNGLTTYHSVRQQLSAMEDVGLALMIHGEEPRAMIFDRESEFINSWQIRKMQEEFPKLKITLEHISSSTAVNYLVDVCNINKSNKIAATITPHHLTCTIDNLFSGCGIRPSMFCCPILKQRTDMLALQELALSGLTNVFYGSDNAPHTDTNKFRDDGKPGIFNIHCGLDCVIDMFRSNDRFDHRIEGFISTNGCNWYNKKVPENKVAIYEVEYQSRITIPDKVSIRNESHDGYKYITPMNAGQKIKYHISLT